jgi:hemerythrin-like domain-containing protein
MRIVTTLLKYDHGILRQVLDVLDDMATEGTFEQHRSIMPQVANFLLKFMDQYHHGKEERFIFPVATTGPPGVAGMVSDLFDDHHKARALGLAIADDVAAWNPSSLATSCRELAAHMRHHIKEEEDIVFPGVDKLIGDKDIDVYERIDAMTVQLFGKGYPKEEEDFANRFQAEVWGPGVVKFEAIRS